MYKDNKSMDSPSAHPGLAMTSVLRKLLLELVELVLDLPALFISEGFLLLAVLQLLLEVLDRLLGILCVEFLLNFNLVAGSIVDLLDFLVAAALLLLSLH